MPAPAPFVYMLHMPLTLGRASFPLTFDASVKVVEWMSGQLSYYRSSCVCLCLCARVRFELLLHPCSVQGMRRVQLSNETVTFRLDRSSKHASVPETDNEHIRKITGSPKHVVVGHRLFDMLPAPLSMNATASTTTSEQANPFLPAVQVIQSLFPWACAATFKHHSCRPGT